jgi:O-antigen/teichoic acid export membrane protein
MKEMDTKGLDHALVSGIAWTAVLRWAAQLISWVGTAYAARILTPGHYGIIAMAMIAIGLVRMVEDFGLDAVFVQDHTLVGEKQAALAGLIIGMGGLLSLIFAALAVPIAGFFEEPQVAPAVALLGLLCVADALQVVPRAVLQRELEFRKLAWVQFLQTVVTQSVLVYGAAHGWGLHALIFNTLAGAFASTLILAFLSPFTVRWPRDFANLARPIAKGWRVLGSRIAYYGYSTADQTIIGKVLGKDALGVYSFAQTFSTTISQEFTAIASRVAPGVFSSVQEHRHELRRYFHLLTEMLACLTFPILVGTALTADLLVAIVLGPQWHAVIAPLQILCFYAMFYSSQVLIGHVLLWTGQFRANMWCSILMAVAMPATIWLSARSGLEAVAWAWVVAFPLANLPSMWIAFRTIDSGFGPWLRTLAPASVACAVMSAAVIGGRAILPAATNPAAEAAISAAIGAASYVAVLWLVFRPRVLAMLDFMRAVRSSGAAPQKAAPENA